MTWKQRLGWVIAYTVAFFALGRVLFAALPVPVIISWSPPQTSADLYIVHQTTNLSTPRPWPVLTTFFGTNTDGTVKTNASIALEPGTNFVQLEMSNFWTATGPFVTSNVASTPGIISTNVVIELKR